VIVAPNDNYEVQKINEATYQALMAGINQVKAGNYTGDIASAIYQTAKQAGYEVIKDYGGHGCGNKVHEDPIILNYGNPQTGVQLVEGMVICIEPMLMTKSDKYYVDQKNNWTVIAKNHKLTCH